MLNTSTATDIQILEAVENAWDSCLNKVPGETIKNVFRAKARMPTYRNTDVFVNFDGVTTFAKANCIASLRNCCQ